MFGNSKRIRANRADSLIGSADQIQGDVHFSGDLIVLGTVAGNVVAELDSDSLFNLSESGRVEGEIRVPNVVIDGTVDGDVYSSKRIQLAANARISGNVYYRLIEMEMGAEVNGSLVHLGDDAKARLSIDASPARLTDESHEADTEAETNATSP
ncbi:MAG: polymer-forming cytoskeletal protein [Pseudomonadota bacterium]